MDGEGGCIITWTLEANSGVFAQRIDSSGAIKWASGGVYVGYGGTGLSPVVSDGMGGIIVPATYRYYHIRSDGTHAWPGGVQFTASFHGMWSISDSASGVIIVYTAQRDTIYSDIFVQHIDSSGRLRWPLDKTNICDYPIAKWHPIGFADGTGGIIAVWDDDRNGPAISIYSGKVDSSGTVTKVENSNKVTLRPTNEILLQNYPNPFNPETTINYQLTVNCNVTLKIFDTLGKEITTLVHEQQTAGSHTIKWNGIDRNGNQVSSGIYFYQFSTSNGTITKKAVYLK